MNCGELRRDLVDRLVERRTARTQPVIRALRDVPRDAFLPGIPPEDAYADRSIALIVENGVTLSSASQPSMIAEMLEQLAVQPGDRVLEIGTGSGYNAALLAHLCGPRGSVVTIDLDAVLAERAAGILRSTGFETVRVLAGDGAAGAAQWAPYDRIILTVAADDVVDAWRAQLAAHGRLVLPLTLRALQESVAFEGRDPLRSVSIVGASFVSLRGSSAIAEHEVEIDCAPTIRLRAAEPGRIDPAAIAQHLNDAPRIVEIENVAADDLWNGLDVWLDVHLSDAALAMANGHGNGACVGEWLSTSRDEPRFATTFALCNDRGIAFFVRERRGRVSLACYGDAGALIDAAWAAIDGWLERGRPPTRTLEISAHARTRPVGADVTLEKASVTLALRWN
jgi:protein-L-isoaspartate(D-aspartate) O-methyltransferase